MVEMRVHEVVPAANADWRVRPFCGARERQSDKSTRAPRPDCRADQTPACRPLHGDISEIFWKIFLREMDTGGEGEGLARFHEHAAEVDLSLSL